jgi:formylglycine-generating enzyme
MRALRFATLILLVAAQQASATAGPGIRPHRSALTVGRSVNRMAIVPAGRFRPLYAAPRAERIAVASFALDRDPITTGEFLAFVERHPEWRRDRVRRVYADAHYLADWPSATDAGSPAALRRPVTQVSWFAARAYCASLAKRLPTVDEWEYVAAASERSTDARGQAAFRSRLLALYAGVGRQTSADSFVNAYGVRAMHGVVWEWTLDFNSVVLDDDSRATGSGADARDRHLYCASASIGATDPSDYPAFLRQAVRAGLGARSSTSTVGFRCAAEVIS